MLSLSTIKKWFAIGFVPTTLLVGLVLKLDISREIGRPQIECNGRCYKLQANPDAVYVGLYNLQDVAVSYGEIKAKSGNVPAGITLAFHDWNGAGIEASKPELQTMVDSMEGDDVSPLWMAERINRDGGIFAVVWDAVGYFSEHPDYFKNGGNQPIRYDDIFSGVYDDYIRSVAEEIRQFGQPIMMSPAAEFNAIGYFSFGAEGNEQVTTLPQEMLCNQYGDPKIPDGPERVRDLYRYVIDIFRAEGVHNVTWFMYSHTAYMNPADLSPEELAVLDFLHPRHYYPGDQYIDWIGNSAYVSTDDPKLNLDFALSHAIEAFAEVTDKPFFIPEFGLTTSTNQNRALRIYELFLLEIPAIPEVRGFAFADADLFEAFFEVPRLGNFPEETIAWQEAVIDSGLYTSELSFRR